MSNKLVEIENFSPPPHAKHILVTSDDNLLTVHLLDKYFNNQGNIAFTISNAKILVKQLLDELYGDIKLPENL